MQCGAACLTMIVNSYGVKRSLDILHIGKMVCLCMLLQKLRMKLASTVKDNYIPLNNLAAQHLPFVPPRLDDNGVKFAPLILQMVEFCLCFFLCVSGIDQLQIFEEFLLILTSDILHSKSSAPKRTHGEDCILATAFFCRRSIVLYASFCCQT